MATVNPTVIAYTSTREGSVMKATWVLTSANETGIAVQFPEWADRTWHVGLAADAFGGATCTIQGSHTETDGDFVGLTNAAGGTPATFAGVGMKAITELPQWTRPKLTTVGAGASITCILVARRANPNRT